MTYKQALDLARAWIRASEDRLEVDEAGTIARPYGWVFVFRPATGFGPLTGGPSPILVDRINGEVRVLGHGALELALLAYEATIPSSQLALSPEMPANVPINRGEFGVIDPYKPLDARAFPELLKQLSRT